MALVKGVNVYVDNALVAADAYFAEHISSADWKAATDPEKSNCLVTGTRILDSLAWIGYAADSAQLLAFPRVGEYFDTRLGMLVDLSTEPYPTRIVHASFEMAIHLRLNPGVTVESDRVKTLTLPKIGLEQIIPAPLIPSVVTRLISPILESRGSGIWWRAN